MIRNPAQYFFLAILGLVFWSTSSTLGGTFRNPLLHSGADPWVIQWDDSYYYMHTGGGEIWIRKSPTLEGIANPVQTSTVFSASGSGPIYGHIWAPELHHLNGKWYIYATGSVDSGGGIAQRMFVLEANTNDPMGSYTFKGILDQHTGQLDATILTRESDNAHFVVYSQWDDAGQSLYIAPLQNPWTFGSPRVRISTPTHPWERIGAPVNEGPQTLKHHGSTFIIYSASGTWTPDYVLGQLRNDDGNWLNPSSWVKHPQPVFKRSDENSVWCTGHGSFTRSPNGVDYWHFYHATNDPTGNQESKRSVRMQPFTWHANGAPNFGIPVPIGADIRKPASIGGPIISGRNYVLRARNSDKFAQVANCDDQSGANVHQQALQMPPPPCQQWTALDLGDGSWRFINAKSGHSLEVANSSTSVSATIRQGAWTGLGSQQWELINANGGYWKLVNRNSGMLMDVSGGPGAVQNGANIHQFTDTGGTNQHWAFEEVEGQPANPGDLRPADGIWKVSIFSELQTAVAGAQPGDSILVRSGPLAWTGVLEIGVNGLFLSGGWNDTFNSQEAGTTVLSGGSGRMIRVWSDGCSIEGFTFQSNSSGNAQMIDSRPANPSTLSLLNNRFFDNSSNSHLIYSDKVAFTLEGNIFARNQTGQQLIRQLNNSLVLRNNTFHNNTAGRNFFGQAGANLVVENNLFSANSGNAFNGSHGFADATSLALSHNLFHANQWGGTSDQALAGTGDNNLTGDPRFHTPGDNLFNLQVGSAAIAGGSDGHNIGAPLNLFQTFHTGTFDGWEQVLIDGQGRQAFAIVPPGVNSPTETPHSGNHFVGLHVPAAATNYDRNSPHDTLLLRSPAFRLNGTSDLTVWLAGGSFSSPDLAGTFVADLSPSTTRLGFRGVALRNATTGVYVHSAVRAVEQPGWEKITVPAAVLAALPQHHVYTLDLIDAADGPLGWVNMDSVSIPGTLATDPFPASGISPIFDQTILVNTNTGALSFTIGHHEIDPGDLQVSGSSSNTTLVPNGNIVFGGSGAERTVTVTPAADRTGSVTITVTVSDGTPVANTSFVVSVVTDAFPMAFDFNDGTIGDWTLTSTDGQNRQLFAVVPPILNSPNGTPHSGSHFIGLHIPAFNLDSGYTQDSQHGTLVIRSPEFRLNGSGDLTAWLSGGGSGGVSLAGTSVASLPTASSTNGFLGVALRNVTTGTYVLSTSKSTGGGEWEQVSFTAAQLGGLPQGDLYTLDLIDARHGGWGWVNMDSVTIPGAISGEEPPPPVDLDKTWIGLNADGANGAWNTAGNWNPSGVPSTSDTVMFGLNPDARVNLGSANQAINGIQISKTGTTEFWTNRTTGATALTIGSGGLTIEGGAGAVSFFFRVEPLLNATQTWQNDSVNTLIVNPVVNVHATTPPALTMTGSGDIFVTGRLGHPTNGHLASLTKSGAGTLTLNGNVFATNGSTVQSGTLLLNAIHASQVTVASGGTLGGTGTLGSTSVNGSLRPGSDGIGLLSFSNSLGLQGSAVTTMEIAGVSTRGTSYDAIDVTLASGLTFGGNLQLVFSGSAEVGSYNLFDFAGNSGGGFGSVTLGGSHSGSLSQTGSGVWTGDAGGLRFTFSESSGDLTVEVPGEPASPLTYAFADGTLEGWTEAGSGGQNLQFFAVVPPSVSSPNITPHSGDHFIGLHNPGFDLDAGYTQDSAHDTIVMRSPEFTLNGSGNLTVWLAGGGSAGVNLAGTNVASLPTASSTGGFLGVALRNVTTGTFVLSASKSTGGNEWEQVSFTSGQLAALPQGDIYTLDLIDARHGGWGWVNMDSVTIPGEAVAVEPPSPPTISSIADQTIFVDTSTGALSFTVGSQEVNAGALTLSGSSSNTSVVPNGNLVFGGSGGARTVTVTPAAGVTGSTTITVTVSDGERTASSSFVVNVVQPPSPPTISSIADQTIFVDTSTGALSFTVDSQEVHAGALTLSGSSSNTSVVPNGNLVFGGSGGARTVTVTPAAGVTGSATITVTVSDGERTASSSFVVNVNATPASPTLVIERWEGSQVRLSWPATALDWILQTSSDVDGPYSDSGLAVTVEENDRAVYDTMDGAKKFYRLVK